MKIEFKCDNNIVIVAPENVRKGRTATCEANLGKVKAEEFVK